VGGFPGEVWTPLLPTPYSPPQHRVHRDAASSSSLRHPPRRPRAPTAAQMPRAPRRWTDPAHRAVRRQPRTKSLRGPSTMATAVHPPQVRRNSLSNVPACAASMESRGICVHMHCRHGLRQLSGCSASPLSNIRSGGCRGVDSSSVASASLSPQRRTRLSLAAAPRLLLRAKPPPPTTPSLRCGTLLLSPSPAAPPRLLLLSCGERPASPLSARRPSLHPARASRAGVRVTAAWAWGGTPSAYDSVSLAVALSPRGPRGSLPLCELRPLSLSLRDALHPRARVRPCFVRCLGVWREPLLPTITSYLSGCWALSSLPAPP
jgi:hypothetical protein